MRSDAGRRLGPQARGRPRGLAVPARADGVHPALRLHHRGPSYQFPPPGLTLRWFAVAWARPDIWRALRLSVRVALRRDRAGAGLGTLAAAALWRTRFFGREAVTLLLVLPIALPGIITGIALRSTFGARRTSRSASGPSCVGHATFCIVVVYNNVIARLRRTSASLIEASMDLGADGFQTFRHVVLPNIATALLAGGMLAFALSASTR